MTDTNNAMESLPPDSPEPIKGAERFDSLKLVKSCGPIFSPYFQTVNLTSNYVKLVKSAIDQCYRLVKLGALSAQQKLNAKKPMADQNKSIDFEKKLQDLEALVAKLETGELSLEESLKAYESGIALTRECQGILEKAQLRVEMASAENAALEDQPEGESSSEES